MKIKIFLLALLFLSSIACSEKVKYLTTTADDTDKGRNIPSDGDNGGGEALLLNTQIVYPLPGDEEVVLRPEIRFRFDNLPATETANIVYSIEPSVPGKWAFNENSLMYSFVPDQDLPPDTAFTVTVSQKKPLTPQEKAKKKTEMETVELKKWSWRTLKNPFIAEVYPLPNETGVTLDEKIRLVLSSNSPSVENIIPEFTITPGKTVSPELKDNTSEWTPFPLWTPDTEYSVTATIRWIDKEYVKRDFKYTWSFKTAFTGETVLPAYGIRPELYEIGYSLHVDDSNNVFIVGGYSLSPTSTDYYSNVIIYPSTLSNPDERYYQLNWYVSYLRSIIPTTAGYYLVGTYAGEVLVLATDNKANLLLDKNGEMLKWQSNLKNPSGLYKTKGIGLNDSLYVGGYTYWTDYPILIKFDVNSKEFSYLWMDNVKYGRLNDLTAIGNDVYFVGFTSSASNEERTETTTTQHNGWIKYVEGGVPKDYLTGGSTTKFLAIDAMETTSDPELKTHVICVGGESNHCPYWFCQNLEAQTQISSFEGTTPGRIETIKIGGDKLYVGGYKTIGGKNRRFLEVFDRTTGASLNPPIIEAAEEDYAGVTKDIEIKGGYLYSTGKIHASNTTLAEFQSNIWLLKYDTTNNVAITEPHYTNKNSGEEAIYKITKKGDAFYLFGTSQIESGGNFGSKLWINKVGDKGQQLWDKPIEGEPTTGSIVNFAPLDMVISKDEKIYATWQITFGPDNLTDAYIAVIDPATGTADWKAVETIKDNWQFVPRNLFLDTDGSLYVFGATYSPYPGIIKKYSIQGNDLKEEWTYTTPFPYAFIDLIYKSGDGNLVCLGRAEPEIGGAYSGSSVLSAAYPIRIIVNPLDGAQIELQEFKTIGDKNLTDPTMALWFEGFVLDGGKEVTLLTDYVNNYILTYNPAGKSAEFTQLKLGTSYCAKGCFTLKMDKVDEGLYAGIFYTQTILTQGKTQGDSGEERLIFFNGSGDVLKIGEDKFHDYSRGFMDLGIGDGNIVVVGDKLTLDGPSAFIKWFDFSGNSTTSE